MFIISSVRMLYLFKFGHNEIVFVYYIQIKFKYTNYILINKMIINMMVINAFVILKHSFMQQIFIMNNNVYSINS